MRSPASLQPQCRPQGNHDDGDDFNDDQTWNMSHSFANSKRDGLKMMTSRLDNADRFLGITIYLLTLSPSRHDRYPWLRCCFAPMSEIRFRDYHHNIFALFCP